MSEPRDAYDIIHEAWKQDFNSLDAFIGTLHKNGYEIRAIEAEAAAPAGLDVPLEAIEWARELVRQGYRDEHVVDFTATGYGLQHPIRCRPNLIGCQFNEWLATQMAPDRDPGRYVMTWSKSGPQYARLAGVTSEGEEG